MKTTRKILAIILTLIIIIATTVMQVNAAIPPQLYGDVYYDEDINVIDATCIQKHLAGMVQISPKSYEAADLDGDCEITILDATYIQQYIAGKISEFPAGEYYYIDEYLYDVIPSYLSGKAMVGLPVDFVVDGYAYPEPSTSYLYVDGEVVDTAFGEDKTLTHTFLQAGVYEIKVELTDKWGVLAGEWSCNYEVIEAVTDKEKPIITNITRDSKYTTRPTIKVDVIYGYEDYSYSYIIKDESGRVVFERRYLDSNTITIDQDVLDQGVQYTLTVIVYHAIDNEDNFVSEDITFTCEFLAPA